MPDVITQNDAQYALDIVERICAEVGPGLPCSNQERQRAMLFAKELGTHLGDENVTVEEFTLAPDAFLNPFSGIFLLLALLLNLSINLLTGISPWVTSTTALILSILSPLLFTIEFMLGKEFVDPFFQQKQSQNVIGRLRRSGTNDVKRLLIISGHHDSAPENVCLRLLSFVNHLFTPKGQHNKTQEDKRLRILGVVFYFLSATYFLGFIVMLVLSIIQVVGVITGSEGIVRAGTLGWVLLVYPVLPALLFGLFSIRATRGGGTVPGAVDNLSASALAVAMSRFLVKNPTYIPEGTEIRFISFGSEEAGLRGSRRFVKRHLDELRRLDMRLLNIEMVAYPEISILSSDINGTVKNSPEMVQSIVTAAEIAGVPYKVSSASIGVGSDAAPFTQADLRAATLLPFQVPQQTVAFYHQKWDTPENLTIEPLLNVLKLAIAWVCNNGD